MSVDAKKETLGFQTEVKQLLDLMVHSLYSNKEIFLRELISNAADAADKLRFEALSDGELYEGDGELSVHVDFDEKARTITVRDNGIGMSREDLIEHLGTIAKSGTRQFFDSLTGDQSKDAQLIGQFGVGFYSVFIIADKVSVTTRRAGLESTHGACWVSSGDGEYTIENVDVAQRGTEVVLHLREDEDEFLNGFRLRNIIHTYSEHITLPINMPAEEAPVAEGEEEPTEPKGDERVNSATALWARSKNDIKDDEYDEFYKHVSHDFEAPLARIHSQVEGKLEYTSLLFIPARAPFDLWDRQKRHGVKLYVRRVFIMDDAEQLMPSYLRFVRGIVDSNDLPLNVSREILQKNRQIDSIRAGSVKKVLGLLKNLANNEAEKYASFWEEFGRAMKEGIIEDQKNQEVLAKLLRFASTHNDSDEQNVSLDAYLERMPEGQDKIYFLTADNWAAAKDSPHLEVFRDKGVEVLLLTDEIDEWLVSHLTNYQDKALKSITKGELDLDDLKGEKDKAEDKSEDKEESAGEMDALAKRLKEALGDKVEAVRASKRLTTSPACLVSSDHDMGAHMERILRSAGQAVPTSKPILEFNPTHPLIVRMDVESDEEGFANWGHLLLDQAVLQDGGRLDDAAGFVSRLNETLLTLLEPEEATTAE